MGWPLWPSRRFDERPFFPHITSIYLCTLSFIYGHRHAGLHHIDECGPLSILEGVLEINYWYEKDPQHLHTISKAPF